MIRCCIVDKMTNRVVNVIEYPDAPIGTPPGMANEMIAVASDTGQIGFQFNGGVFTDTAPPPPVIAPPTVDEIYDQVIRDQRVLKAIVLAINDGSLAVGANKTGAQLKAIIKAKM